ncbi:DUF2974 domain-containing protein [Streptococcus thermophilus]|nr:DUF2974 domain-containing protein [Streptococcus thermophilus]MCE2233513.1 DUF2974 domain-containing protein [Streptococcus thermophilus]MCE2253127.1 DUF2974 domain-containing protein [Streptococcus thermophilus]MCE2254594.1 DUF2974 domain-containing protein [Streptococcus thermophilus]MCE2254976.1 DUF2974 domain-containing protein [Streptococcus thermophilus]
MFLAIQRVVILPSIRLFKARLVLREQIAELLLLDSPGLMKPLLENPAYQELKAKMTVIRPRDSVVESCSTGNRLLS